MFEMVINTPLYHLKTQSFKRKERWLTEKSLRKRVRVKVLARSENSKNHLDKKSMIFSIRTDLSQKMPAVIWGLGTILKRAL